MTSPADLAAAGSIGEAMPLPDSSNVEADENDEAECRICRSPAGPDAPLFHPCRCSGSVGYVHQACLDRWLQHSGRTFCEVNPHDIVVLNVPSPTPPAQRL